MMQMSEDTGRNDFAETISKFNAGNRFEAFFFPRYAGRFWCSA
jgi:hypothetical protein